jgi:DNA primase
MPLLYFIDGYIMKSFKTICPSCHGDNFYITPNNGMGYCFDPSCHYMEKENKGYSKKRIRSDNVAEIRDYYSIAARYYHSSLDTKALNFLYARGFNDHTIQDRLIGYCPTGTSPIYRDPIAKEAGLADMRHNAFLADRIVFPYFKNRGTIIDIRGRAIDPEEEIKYKSPFNDSCYRGATYPYNHDLRDNKVVLISEGEIKADIATQIGFNCLALPGMGSWRNSLIQEDQQFIIVFDSQLDMRGVNAAIKKAAKHLDDPLIATLPLLGKNKMDVDTFILARGETMFADIINQAITYSVWESLQTW